MLDGRGQQAFQCRLVLRYFGACCRRIDLHLARMDLSM